MCGRYTLKTPVDVLMQMFHVAWPDDASPRFNIAPTQQAPVITGSRFNPRIREVRMMRWGLVPSWAEDLSIGSRMINARSETASGKPSFRSAFRKHRCLIPADGFFEWQKLSDGSKQPWWMHFDDEQPFLMAGLFETWAPPEEQRKANAGRSDLVSTFTILTTSANAQMSALHERMPVILPEELWELWLSDQASVAQLEEVLQPWSGAPLTLRRVGKAMNRPQYDQPDCLDEVTDGEPLAEISEG